MELRHSRCGGGSGSIASDVRSHAPARARLNKGPARKVMNSSRRPGPCVYGVRVRAHACILCVGAQSQTTRLWLF